MTTVALAPLALQQFNQNGIPVSGGFLWTYAGGTTTKQSTYADSTGNTPNANPVVLDANGQAAVFLDITKKYKFTLSPSTDIDPGTHLPNDPPTHSYWTEDYIAYIVIPAIVPYAVAGGTADIITATYPNASPTLTDGYTVQLRIATPNATTSPTFAPTLTSSLQTVHNIKKLVGNSEVNVAIGDLQGDVTLIYDLANTVWRVQGPGYASAHVALADLATLATNATNATVAIVANRTDSAEVTVTANATTGNIFAAVANSILWDDAGGAITCTIFPNTAKAGMVRELRCNGATMFTAGANLLIEGVPSGTTITLAAGALCKVRAITTTQFKMTYILSGTFTATGTGFTVNPTAAAFFEVENGWCKLYIISGVMAGTSNATTFTITGLPACIQPISIKVFGMLSGTNNSAWTSLITAEVSGSMMQLLISNSSTGWTNSGVKGLQTSEFLYSLN